MSASGDGITGVVLAGGLGRRMGGVDKGLVEFRGRTMVEQVLERLRPQVDELIINANRNGERYAAFGYPVFADEIEALPDRSPACTPVLSRASHPLVATAPCDSPSCPPTSLRD